MVYRKKAALFLTTILFVLIVGCAQQQKMQENVQEENLLNNAIDSQSESSVKTFVLEGENFRYLMNGAVNPDLIVKAGEKVRIVFSSNNGFHDFVIDELGVASERVRPGDQPVFVEFTPDKKGTFNYYCSVGSHRAQGMMGNIIVE